VGGNNAGKTTLLEALNCALANGSDSQSLHTAFRRGVLNGAQYSANTISNNASDASFEVTIDGVLQKCSLNRSGVRAGALCKENGLAINIFADDTKQTTINYGAVKSKKKKSELLTILKKFDSNILDLDPTPVNATTWELRVQTEADEEVSLNFMGQGFNRVLNMYCRIIASDRKIILIDEVELGLHHKSIPLVWDALKKISLDRDLQMFITTHSNECIQAAVETFKEQPEIFQLIRLEKHRSSVIAKCIPHDYVDAALEHDVEIR
jgi:AAA15 family ATPase/GTPase